MSRALAEIATDEAFTLLHFMVQDLQCCLRVDDVDRIMTLLDMRPVPGGPDYLIGLINLHGESVAGIDLSLRMGYPRTEDYSIDTPMVLCCCDGRQMGMVVSEILAIQRCKPTAMQMRPEFEQGDQLYEAVVNTDRGLSLLLDLKRVCDVQLGAIDGLS